jgi:Zn-dependent protease
LGAYLLAAVLAAVLFVASLLAHEMAHAIVAQRNGVAVDGITLWLLGGIARLRGETPTPGADFRIAVIGPITSLLAAGVFAAAAWLAELAVMTRQVVNGVA